jgi:hypothetical protein
MTPVQQTLVQTSFAKVVPIADTAATLFYEDLFRRDPSLRALFKEDVAEQRRKLMAMIGTVVAGLGDWGNIAPARNDGRSESRILKRNRSKLESIAAESLSF